MRYCIEFYCLANLRAFLQIEREYPVFFLSVARAEGAMLDVWRERKRGRRTGGLL